MGNLTNQAEFPALEEEVLNKVQLLIDRFCDYFKLLGYKIFKYNDKYLGWGAQAYKNDDLYRPYYQIISFMDVVKYEVSVTASDRRGNMTMSATDDWILCYTLDDVMCDNAEARLDDIMDDAYNNTCTYNEANRIDMQDRDTERRLWSGKKDSMPVDRLNRYRVELSACYEVDASGPEEAIAIAKSIADKEDLDAGFSDIEELDAASNSYTKGSQNAYRFLGRTR